MSDNPLAEDVAVADLDRSRVVLPLTRASVASALLNGFVRRSEGLTGGTGTLSLVLRLGASVSK